LFGHGQIPASSKQTKSPEKLGSFPPPSLGIDVLRKRSAADDGVCRPRLQSPPEKESETEMADATILLTDYIPSHELAAGLDVSERTLSRYERQPDGLPSVMIGGRKFYRIDSVRKWLESRERHPNPRRGGRHAVA
jgi:hypothetical protein